jgi:beta-glucosidase
MSNEQEGQTLPAYLDPGLPVAARVADLVSRMTLAEKVSQMVHHAPAVERLGIPEYDWWNEALHGVARAGIATVFPQAIGLGAAWDDELVQRVAVAISDEARARHHEALRNGNRATYFGLTFWSPNINIFRDPRWGRGQETYGEDPFLTGRTGLAFVRGLQGNDPHYLKLVATPKHYAVHSGPENDRHHFDARVDERDLRQTYLPAFKVCVEEGHAFSVMGAYNRTNGEACCASPTLLEKILRGEWGFEGYVVSDCGAIDDIYQGHKLAKTTEEAAALAVNAGCDLNCGCTYEALEDAVAQGLITEAAIDQAVRRLFTARIKLGMFDPPEKVPYAQIPFTMNDSPAHRQLALETARASLVLLKNENSFLPLPKDLESIAVIGPNADNVDVLLGNYNGTPSQAVTILEGIRALASPATQVSYARGCAVLDEERDGFAEAVDLARRSKVAVLVIGLSQQVEGEEGQEEGNPPGIHSIGDRSSLDLPGVQGDLLKAVHATGTPLVVVLVNGSAVAVNDAQAQASAILEAWYPGQAGGTAVAEALFGEVNPGGRLPVTFYKSVEQLPPFDEYRMANRTYRYFESEPLYPFGFGLSYTTFAYHNLAVEPGAVHTAQALQVTLEVENTGRRAGDEVVQLYLQDVTATVPTPRLQLVGFKRLKLAPGERKKAAFALTPDQMALVDIRGKWVVEPGEFHLWAGGCQPDLNHPERNASLLQASFVVTK